MYANRTLRSNICYQNQVDTPGPSEYAPKTDENGRVKTQQQRPDSAGILMMN